MRLEFFDFLDEVGWPLPVTVRIEEVNGLPDVIVSTENQVVVMN